MNIEDEIDRVERLAAATAHLDDEARGIFLASVESFRERKHTMNDLLAALDLAKEHLTKARAHQRGGQTDTCLLDLIRAVANLESVLRELEGRMRVVESREVGT